MRIDQVDLKVLLMACAVNGIYNSFSMAGGRAVFAQFPFVESSNDVPENSEFAVDIVAGAVAFAVMVPMFMALPRSLVDTLGERSMAYLSLMLCAAGLNVAAKALETTNSPQLLLTAGESVVGYAVIPVLYGIGKILHAIWANTENRMGCLALTTILSSIALGAGANAGALALANYGLDQYDADIHTHIGPEESSIVGAYGGGLAVTIMWMLQSLFSGEGRELSNPAKALLLMGLMVGADVLATSALHGEQAIPEVLTDVAAGTALVTAGALSAAGMFRLCCSSRHASLASQDATARPQI